MNMYILLIRILTVLKKIYLEVLARTIVVPPTKTSTLFENATPEAVSITTDVVPPVNEVLRIPVIAPCVTAFSIIYLKIIYS